MYSQSSTSSSFTATYPYDLASYCYDHNDNATGCYSNRAVVLCGEKDWDCWGLGRFLSTDPLTRSYPMLTPYQFASNTPIQAIDLDGLEALHFELVDGDDGETVINIEVDENLPLTTTGVFVSDARGDDGAYTGRFAPFPEFPEQFPNFSAGIYTQEDLDKTNANLERKDKRPLLNTEAKAAVVFGAAGGSGMDVAGTCAKMGGNLAGFKFRMGTNFDGKGGYPHAHAEYLYPKEGSAAMLDYKIKGAFGVGYSQTGKYNAATGERILGAERISIGPIAIEQNSFGELSILSGPSFNAGLGLGIEASWKLRLNLPVAKPKIDYSDSEQSILELKQR